MFSFLDSLILWTGDRNRLTLGHRFASRELRRHETVVQCYLFSNHLVVTTRASSGKLHLVKVFSFRKKKHLFNCYYYQRVVGLYH